MKSSQSFLSLLIALVAFSCSTPQQAEQTSEVETTTEEFKYAPPLPENGSLFGIVEMGGTGFNSFIVNLDTVGNWKLEKANFGESNVYEGDATLEAVRSGLEAYIAGMLEQGVTGDKIHFIQSSTASSSEKVQQINVALKELGYAINNVDVEKEGIFAFKAIMPAPFIENSFVVDIGSGNTKVSWMEGGEIKSISFEGSKYYQKGLSDEGVYAAIKARILEIPADKTYHCFMIGGAAYNLAKLNDDYSDRYTPLDNPNDYQGIEDPKVLAGLNIYKALYDNLENCNDYVFDWDGNFSIGFLLSIQ
ncbi:MAG: hypothetical protein R8G66_20075 [Cytophagales bacterium]|nr:hypothetical protein [Cytophagales bacterium]